MVPLVPSLQSKGQRFRFTCQWKVAPVATFDKENIFNYFVSHSKKDGEESNFLSSSTAK